LSAIDTGTTLIGAPHDDVVSLYSSIPGSVELGSNDPGFYAYPCSTNVSVSMSFGGKLWPIDPQDFNVGRVNNGRTPLCVGAIFDLTLGTSSMPDSSTPSWIVGDTFLKNVYSVFRSNPPSVGFAELSTAAGGTGTAGPGSTSDSSSTSADSSSPSGISFANAAMLTTFSSFLMLSTVATVIMLCL